MLRLRSLAKMPALMFGNFLFASSLKTEDANNLIWGEEI